MPHTSADGMYLECRVRAPRWYYPIVAKALEGHLICHKDTAIPRHIERIPQFCPHRIAEFIKFLRDIHVIDQNFQTAHRATYVHRDVRPPPFGLVMDGAGALLWLTGRKPVGLLSRSSRPNGFSVSRNKSRKRTSKDGARGDSNVNDRRWPTLFSLECRQKIQNWRDNRNQIASLRLAPCEILRTDTR